MVPVRFKVVHVYNPKSVLFSQMSESFNTVVPRNLWGGGLFPEHLRIPRPVDNQTH